MILKAEAMSELVYAFKGGHVSEETKQYKYISATSCMLRQICAASFPLSTL